VSGFIRLRLRAAGALAVLAAMLAALPWATADGSLQVKQVEEDWELRLVTPDPAIDSPQVVCVISPSGNIDGIHSTFEINHQNLPTFVAGGMQVQIWSGGRPLGAKNNNTSGVFNTPDEVVTWTTRMKLDGGALFFQVIDGSSATWGNFGGDGNLKMGVTTDLTDLSSYDPATSVRFSGVTFGGNRVASLKLKAVRVTFHDNSTVTDETVRTVYPRQAD
jgi:hypothetical protein